MKMYYHQPNKRQVCRAHLSYVHLGGAVTNFLWNKCHRTWKDNFHLLSSSVSKLHCVSKNVPILVTSILKLHWWNLFNFAEASKHFRKLCPRLILTIRSCYLALSSWLCTRDTTMSTFSSVHAMHCLPLPGEMSTILPQLQQQLFDNTLLTTFVWKLCHKLPSKHHIPSVHTNF